MNYIGVRERHDSALDTVKVKKLKKWLNDIVQRRCKLVVFDVRTTVKDLRTLFPRSLKDVLFQDVELCHWVYEPSSTSMTLNKLSKMYTQSVVSPSKGSLSFCFCLCWTLSLIGVAIWFTDRIPRTCSMSLRLSSSAGHLRASEATSTSQ